MMKKHLTKFTKIESKYLSLTDILFPCLENLKSGNVFQISKHNMPWVPKTPPISKYSVFFSFLKLLPGAPFFLSLSLNKQKATALIDQSRGACSWKVGQATSTAANSLGCTSKTEHFPPQNISPLKKVIFVANIIFPDKTYSTSENSFPPWQNIFRLKNI